MGSTSSKSTSIVDIANTFVTDISVEVLTKNTTTAAGTQTINISCTDAAYAAAVAACTADNKSNNELALAIIQANKGDAEIAKIAYEMKKIPAASCDMCSASNITMDMNVAINTQAISDNTIANAIQSKLSAALETALKSKTEGGIGKTKSEVNSLTTIKNYVENNFDTKIVNDTLNSYTFSQTLNSSNMKLSNINMKLVGTALGSAIVQNAIKSNAEVASAISSVVDITAETKGTDISLFGGFGSIIIGIICLIGLIFGARMFMMFMGGSGSSQIMQQFSQMQPIQQPTQQQMQQPIQQPTQQQMQQPIQQPLSQQMQQPLPQLPMGISLPSVNSLVSQMNLPYNSSDSHLRSLRS